MKKTIILSVVLILVLLFAGLLAAPFLFKGQLKDLAKQELNDRLDAVVDFRDVSVSLLKSFPDISISLKDVSITGKGVFEEIDLARIGALNVSFDLMSVIKGNTSRINSIILDNPNIQAVVLEDGTANWDIYQSTEAIGKGEIKAESQVRFTIQEYGIRNGSIVYKDLESGIECRAEGLNHKGSGDFQKNQFLLRTATSADALSLINGRITYLNAAKLDMKTDIDMDLNADTYVLKDNSLALNDLILNFEGSVDNAKQLIDLSFSSNRNEFKQLLSMVPAVYQKDFRSVKTGGSMDVSGQIKGSYKDGRIPGFNLNVGVSDGMFQYPGLPTAVNNIRIDANLSNPGGVMDQTVVDVKKAHLEIGKDPIDFTLNVRNPVSDPNVKTKIKGQLNLAKIPEFYPMEDVQSIDGKMDADVLFEGKMSDVERKRFSNVKADGQMKLNNIRYESENLTMPVYVKYADLKFTPRYVELMRSYAEIGNSDFDVTGTLDNLIGYLLTDEKLTGQLLLRSKQVDANQWMTDDVKGSDAEVSASAGYFRVPDGLDLSATGYIDKVLYDDIEITEVSSKIRMSKETLHLSDFNGKMMGGTARMNGSYSTKDVEVPRVKLSYEVKNFDARQTYQFFDVAKGFAPIMKHIEGKFNSDLTIDGTLTESLDLNLNTVTGNGLVSISNATISGFPLIEKMAETLKINELKRINVKNAWTVFELRDGRIVVDPFDVKKGNITMNVAGSNGLDYSIDYKVVVDVPASELGNSYSMVTDWIAKNPIPGLKKAVPDVVQFHLDVGGTLDKPSIKLARIKARQEQSLQEQLTVTVKDEVEKKKEEAKKEVQNQVEAVKEDVNKEIDKAKEEAEQKVQEEIDKSKEKAKEKLKNIFGRP